MSFERVRLQPRRKITPIGIPSHSPRQGWKQAFAAANGLNAKMLLDSLVQNAFDRKEWKWRFPQPDKVRPHN
jgi:hypothetical protein